MKDVFKIEGPTCISFSGGRTSAYMLYRILQAWDGQLPDDVVVCFANTGKEMEETLRFVDRCSREWRVPIIWLEYEEADKPKDRWRQVTFETASRNGEPFEKSINQNGKPYLPNPVKRICTINMKIRVINHYLKSLGWDHSENDDIVGIRADEARRAAKISRDRTPLVVAGITKKDVGLFWSQYHFDLELPNMNGVTMHGNCDLCFLKGASQIQSLIAEKPERAIWWANQEERVASSGMCYGDGARFRKDRPSYRQMYEYALAQSDWVGNTTEETIACFCGD